MSEPQSSPSADLVRWTFTPRAEKRNEIRDHLLDLGADVHVQGDQVVASWEEPEGDLEDLVADLWEINGESFEITHEEFQRLNLFVYHDDEEDGNAEKAVA